MTVQPTNGGVNFRVFNEGSECRLDFYLGNDCLSLMGLITNPARRREGHATRLIAECKEVAKAQGKPLKLFVGAYDDRPMTNDELQAFYERQGFVVTNPERRIMEWTP